MTRRELILQKLSEHPEGLTTMAIWNLCWGDGADQSHGISPDDPWATLNKLADEGLVIRTSYHRGRVGVTWKKT